MYFLQFLMLLHVMISQIGQKLLYSSYGRCAAVVSNGNCCAEVGSRLLKEGGSATDVAIATLLCDGVVLPYCTGIGGGFVATHYSKSTRKVETLIARECAPAAAHKNMFVGLKNVKGIRACAVPGEILGFWELHKKHGRLPWKTILEPAIKICRKGYRVSWHLAKAILTKEEQIRREPSMAAIFIKKNGKIYKEGERIKHLKLGETLERIAINGPGEMYDGGIVGKHLIQDIKEMGGILTENDLKNFRVRWQDSNHITARVTDRCTLYTTPLPTSGVLLSFILNILDDLYTDDPQLYYHRIIEAFKHAFGQRTHLGDWQKDNEMANSIREASSRLSNADFIKSIQKLVYDGKTFQESTFYGAKFVMPNNRGTANVATLDTYGNALSITSTINTKFASKLRSNRTGIILNDQMDDFCTPGVINSFGVPASPANYIQPGKIPFSSMCPSIIIDKEHNARMLVGAAGGTNIITSVALAIIKFVTLKKPLEEAVNGFRVHHQLAPMHVDVEAEAPEHIWKHLLKVGHVINRLPKRVFGAALTTIGVCKDGTPTPLCDRRRLGSTALICNLTHTDLTKLRTKEK